MTQEEYYRDAVRSLKEAVKVHSGDSECWRTLAQAHMMLGEFDEAVDANINALRIDPRNVWALVLMGNIYYNGKRDLATARGFFERALEAAPKNPLVLGNYATALAKAGEIAKAVPLFKKAIDANPGHLPSYHGLALAYRSQNNWGGCYNVSSRGLELGAPRAEDPSHVLFAQLAALKEESRAHLEADLGSDWAEKLAREDAEEQRRRTTERFNAEHADHDPARKMMMASYMAAAEETLSRMDEQDRRMVAMQMAELGTRGYSVDEGRTYSVPALPGREMSGYQALAYYYVAFKLAFPQMLPLLKLPFDDAYELSKVIGFGRKGGVIRSFDLPLAA